MFVVGVKRERKFNDWQKKKCVSSFFDGIRNAGMCFARVTRHDWFGIQNAVISSFLVIYNAPNLDLKLY